MSIIANHSDDKIFEEAFILANKRLQVSFKKIGLRDQGISRGSSIHKRIRTWCVIFSFVGIYKNPNVLL